MMKLNNICVIDDDPIVVFGMRKMLDSIVSYKSLYTYTNGLLALDGLQLMLNNENVLPEIIFLDINMPIMDGWQFLEEFIAIPTTSKIRINIVTSSIDSVDQEKWESFRTQTHHVLTYNRKPMSKEDLAAITKVA